jgi:hypothetical protein
MATKSKKSFDAVAESRKWRQKTSALLATMSAKERIKFINRRLADFPTNGPGRTRVEQDASERSGVPG